VAHNFPASAAHVQHTHSRLDGRDGKRLAQAARKMLAVRFDKFFVPFAGGEKIVFVV
jgi:hypothetical protein